MRWRMLAPAATAAALLLSGCSGGEQGRTVVASFYPLAYAAERIAGPGWEVIDLTPPGTEAHDVELSLEDRAAIEDADAVIYLGDIGFQPQVEAAVEEATGAIVDASRLLPEQPLRNDPHFWLDPVLFGQVVIRLSGDLNAADTRLQRVRQDLDELDHRFRVALNDCRYRVAIVPHEAFGYLGRRYGFRQWGLAGKAPEGEASPARLAGARVLIEEEAAGAIFYEATQELTRRTAESLAADTGVPALPLSTLESQPPSGNYLGVMEDNLESLRRGLGCE